MREPASPDGKSIQQALRRLRGQLVATPLIGELRLPGYDVPLTLRVKAESLQTGGSLYFRGAMHYLLQQLGALKGITACGAGREVLAAATAASLHRLPCVVFPQAEPPTELWQLLQASGAEVRPRGGADEARAAAAAWARSEGYRLLPGVEDAGVAAGIATVGIELAEELAGDARLVVVSPAELAPCVALGLGTRGRTLRVHGVDDHAVQLPESLAASVRAGLRLEVDRPSLAALQWALQHEECDSACVVFAV